MSKAPAFQFYIKDWLSDPELKMASHSTKGIWIDILCFMWESSERGKIKGTIEQIKKLVSATNSDMDLFILEAKMLNFCDITNCTNLGTVTNRTEMYQNVTIINRRMHQEYINKQNTRLRVQKYRRKQKSNTNVTPSSSSSSPTANIVTHIPFDKIMDLYNSILDDLPNMRIWSSKRKAVFKRRWESNIKTEKSGLSNTVEFWENFFKYIKDSLFLMGKKGTFQASFDWIINESNFIKIIEGNYHK